MWVSERMNGWMNPGASLRLEDDIWVSGTRCQPHGWPASSFSEQS